MHWNEEYDVVVMGSGVAGLSAAVAAHEAGLRTLVVEKADRLGGSTTYSYGLIWIPRNHLEMAAGYSDDLDEVLQYMEFLGGGQHSPERVRVFAENCPEAVAFFANRCGIRFRIVKGIKDFYHGRAPGTRPEGRTIEHDLISGLELGEWRKLLLLPDATPYAITAEETDRLGRHPQFRQLGCRGHGRPEQERHPWPRRGARGRLHQGVPRTAACRCGSAVRAKSWSWRRGA